MTNGSSALSNDWFIRDASGRLTFHASGMSAENYPSLCREIVSAFGLIADCGPLVGPEQIFWDCRRSEQMIGLDWDIWMGFMIVAKTVDAEPLVRAIAASLQARQ